MIKSFENARTDGLKTIADNMVICAMTAPKASGKDDIRAMVVDGKEKDALTKKMREIGEREGADFFIRDAGNVDNCELVVLIACIKTPYGKGNCTMCGYGNCAENVKHNGACAFNTVDLGIALGSAVSFAADHRVDNRIMYSCGKAALELEYFEDAKLVYAIPLSATNKSIFFDRGAGAVLETH